MMATTATTAGRPGTAAISMKTVATVIAGAVDGVVTVTLTATVVTAEIAAATSVTATVTATGGRGTERMHSSWPAGALLLRRAGGTLALTSACDYLAICTT